MRWIVTLIALVVVAGCQTPPTRHVDLTVHDRPASSIAASLVGHNCRVQFRRDAMGLTSPSGVTTTDNWAHRMAVKGKVLQLTDQWLVLTGEDGKPDYIPQSVILILEVLD